MFAQSKNQNLNQSDCNHHKNPTFIDEATNLEGAKVSGGVAMTLGLVVLLEQSARLGAVSETVRHIKKTTSAQTNRRRIRSQSQSPFKQIWIKAVP